LRTVRRSATVTAVAISAPPPWAGVKGSRGRVRRTVRKWQAWKFAVLGSGAMGAGARAGAPDAGAMARLLRILRP